MAITFAEITGLSGISEADFDSIFTTNDSLLKQIIVQRHTPIFTLHDSNGRVGNEPFSVAADDLIVLRATNDSGVINVEYISLEDDIQTSPNSWSGSTTLTSTALPNLIPKVVRQSGGWDVLVLQDDGQMMRYSSVDGTGSWTNERFGLFTFPIDGTVKSFTYGSDIEIVYYWLYVSSSNHYRLRYALSTDSIYDFTTEIVWFDAPVSLDCLTYHDSIDDSDNSIDGLDVRHAIIMSMPLPAFYTFTNIEATPTKKMVPAGGIISFIVRPPIDTVRDVQFSNEHPVQTFDQQTSLQYRGIAHVSGMSSVFGPSNPSDTFYVAALGGDGDINGDDTSHGYTALYYYSSRDNVNWSMDRIVPITDLAASSEFASGVALVRCGNYVYLVSAKTTLRSPASGEFGIVHPDWILDITPNITNYSSTLGDIRQTRVALDNPQGHYNNSLLLTAVGGLSMVTKIGKHIDGEDYLFQVALEDIDSVSPHRERPTQEIEIQARDRMAWLVDRTQSPDAILYDNLITGSDNFAAINGQKDSGLKHVATIEGTFSTSGNTLKLISNYKEGIELSTFSSSMINGAMQSTFLIPRPEDHALPGETVTNGNNPAYAGFVFHVLDKDNFWYCYYDYWAQGISVGFKKNGKLKPQTFITVSSWFKSQGSGGLPFTMRVEFRYDTLYIYTLNNIGVLQYQANYQMRGRGATYAPMQQGGSGLIGCGSSDEDTGLTEPDPTVILTDGPAPNVVPSRLLILMADGRLIRATGTDTGTDTPNYSLAAGPGLYSSAISLSNDPYEADTIHILSTGEIRKVATIWDTPVESSLYTIAAPYQQFVGNLGGSINRKNWFAWMAREVYDSPWGRYWFMYTTDNFRTVHAALTPYFTGDGGTIHAMMSWVPGLFNTDSHGRVYVVNSCNTVAHNEYTGNPRFGAVFKSDDWGLTWSTHAQYQNLGGGINIFYKNPDGSDNARGDYMMLRSEYPYDVSPRYVHVNGDTAVYTEVAAPQDGGEGGYSYNPHHISISTDNGNYQAIVNGDMSLAITDNAWATATIVTPPGGAAGVSGYPPSPDYYVAWNGNNLQMTFDRGITWYDFGASLATWWAANVGGSEPGIRYVYADLAEFYDIPKWNGV